MTVTHGIISSIKNMQYPQSSFNDQNWYVNRTDDAESKFVTKNSYYTYLSYAFYLSFDFGTVGTTAIALMADKRLISQTQYLR